MKQILYTIFFLPALGFSQLPEEKVKPNIDSLTADSLTVQLPDEGILIPTAPGTIDDGILSPVAPGNIDEEIWLERDHVIRHHNNADSLTNKQLPFRFGPYGLEPPAPTPPPAPPKQPEQ